MTAVRTVILALVVALAAAAAASAGDGQTVLVIGDSLAQGTAYDWYRDGRSLKRRLATAGWRVREKYGNGLQLDEGADLVARWPARLPPVLVVQLGTNSDPRLPAVFRKQVLRIVDAAGPRRCVVWVNMFGPRGYAPLNRVLDRLAAARPGFRVIDWAAAASKHPEWLENDLAMGVHPMPVGYYWRQRAILREADACERWLQSSAARAGRLGREELSPTPSLRSPPPRMGAGVHRLP